MKKLQEKKEKQKLKGGYLEKLKKEGLNLCFTIKFRNLENESKMFPRRGKYGKYGKSDLKHFEEALASGARI